MFVSNKLAIIFSALALPMLVATAQEASKDAGQDPKGMPGNKGFARPERRMMPGMGIERQLQAGGPIFMRMLSRPEFIKGLGLPEETVTKLTEGLAKIDEQEKALREEREKLMKAQAEMMAALMSDRTKTGEEVRQSIAAIEALQGKLFSLNIDRMLVVRDNLTDEQIKQASELVKKRFESRRNEMMERRGRRVGPQGSEGKGPRGLKEKAGVGEAPAAAPETPPPSPQPADAAASTPPAPASATETK